VAAWRHPLKCFSCDTQKIRKYVPFCFLNAKKIHRNTMENWYVGPLFVFLLYSPHNISFCPEFSAFSVIIILLHISFRGYFSWPWECIFGNAYPRRLQRVFIVCLSCNLKMIGSPIEKQSGFPRLVSPGRRIPRY